MERLLVWLRPWGFAKKELNMFRVFAFRFIWFRKMETEFFLDL